VVVGENVDQSLNGSGPLGDNQNPGFHRLSDIHPQLWAVGQNPLAHSLYHFAHQAVQDLVYCIFARKSKK
jgi:hypothetical protein